MICRRCHLFAHRLTRYLAVIVGVAAILCIRMGLGTFWGSSSRASDGSSYKYYTSVVIKNGDTLWDIAAEYSTEEYGSLQEYVTEVKALNGLQSNSIRSGQSLIVPYYSSELK